MREDLWIDGDGERTDREACGLGAPTNEDLEEVRKGPTMLLTW